MKSIALGKEAYGLPEKEIERVRIYSLKGDRMVNLRHPDNIFYDREGDLFIITTDLDGRQEVVCKTNLECVKVMFWQDY